jgi:hypothetical protein
MQMRVATPVRCRSSRHSPMDDPFGLDDDARRSNIELPTLPHGTTVVFVTH